MKLGVLLCALAISATASAQLVLPAPSPHAAVTQTVGITDITVDYSSPGVKGRKIWGELVPFGELWRTGANAATKLTVSRDVTIEGKAVPAGTYSLFTIPKEKGAWTVVIHKKADQGTFGYDAKNDLVRFEVTPGKAAFRERMAFIFSETADDGTRLDLEWGELRLSLKIAVDTKAHAKAAVTAHVDGAWRPLASAARYLSEVEAQHDEALRLVDASLAVKETWFSLWIKAQIQQRKGDKAGALASATRALELGNADKGGNFFWKADIEKAVKDWK